MPLVVKDRVLETTSTTGTGTLTLSGAVAGFQSFSVIGDGNTTYYTIVSGTNWEVGIGTYTSAGTTLSRDTVLESSAGGTTKINVASGAQVFVTYPAERSVDTDTAQTLTNKTLDGGTVVTANSSADALRITQTGSGNAIRIEDAANPDATPTVIDQNGRVIVGGTTPYSADTVTPKIQVVTDTVFDGGFGGSSWSSDANGQITWFAKSKSGTIGTHSAVTTNDILMDIRNYGSDGSAFAQAARIVTAVDGTVASNSVPSRITFSTTAVGGTSATERMRIDNAGQVGIGTTPAAARSLVIARNLTGSTTAIQCFATSVIQSDVTSNARAFSSSLSTAAASFTLADMRHFYAFQGTLGAGSAVTTQYGFWADASLVGATNNYGFFSSIPSGTGRWNFYANGTADNFLNGSLLMFGTTPLTIGGVTPTLQIQRTDGAFQSLSRFSNDALPANIRLSKSRGTTLGTNTVLQNGDAVGFLSFNGADGATYLEAARIQVDIDDAPGTNDMPGRIVFSTTANGASTITERMRITNAGLVGIGATPSAGQTLVVARNITGSTAGISILGAGTVQSDVTSRATYFNSFASTAATTFTLTQLIHFYANQSTFGAGSTVSSQYGFLAENSLVNATNNYGFFSNIPSGTGRWNFFANGTANNAFAGNTSFGTTAAPTVAVDVIGTVQARPAATQDGVAIAGRAGGTGSFEATITPTTLSANRTVTLPDADINFATGLPVANGGTGTTSLTANNVILGNGTSAVQFVAPGASGNVLTSNGTTWTSAASVSLSANNAFTGANTFYNNTGQTFGTGTSTQDGIILAGRAGGTTSLRVTITPATLTSSRTVTLPDANINFNTGLPVANGGTGSTTAAGARTNLGATAVGSNFFTLTNPSAITFPRINADNTVSTLDAATFRTAIGAGTGNGSVTSVAAGNGMNFTTITGTGSVTLGTPSDISNTTTNSVTANSHTHALSGELVETTTGSPLYYGARAWVNINGVSAPASIRASANVTSVTDGGTGVYTVNITTAMPDTNYAVVTSGGSTSGTTAAIVAAGNYATSSFAIDCRSGSNVLADRDFVCCGVFR